MTLCAVHALCEELTESSSQRFFGVVACGRACGREGVWGIGGCARTDVCLAVERAANISACSSCLGGPLFRCDKMCRM